MSGTQTQTDAYGLTVSVTGTGPFVGRRSDGNVVENTTVSGVMTAFAGMAPASYVLPAQPPPTTIDPYDFMNRFTSSEAQMIQTAALGNWQIQFWMAQLAGSPDGLVNVTNSKVTSGIAMLVTLGLLTQARGAQILNLAEASP
jgi:hypothetical protein